MKAKHVNKGIVLSLLFILSGNLYSYTSFDFSTPFIAPGLSAAYSTRSGYRLYSNMTEEELIGKQSLFTGGILLGKRFQLFSRFRLQISGNYDYGISAEDTIFNVPLSDGTARDLIRYSAFSIGTLASEIQFYLPPRIKNTLFFTTGVSVHYTSLEEQEFDVDKTIRIDDPHLISTKHLSLGFNIGAGIEFPVNNRLGGAIVYGVRTWGPVKYIETREAFPMGADYRERFLTQYIQINLLYCDSSTRR